MIRPSVRRGPVLRRLLYVRRGMTSYVGLASRHLASFSRSLSSSRAAAKVLWRFVHPQLRLCQPGGPSATPLPGSELAETLEVRTHSRLDTLAGKGSSAGGGAINAGPIGTGGRGSARAWGAAWGGPGARASRPFSAATPLSVLGSLGLRLGERETGGRPAPCGLQREFRTRRPLPPAPARPGVGTARAAGRRRGFPSRGMGGDRGLRRAACGPPATGPRAAFAACPCACAVRQELP